ncbi:MAG: DUF2914 domain-containing protein [Gammaproteobacteria bacterium]|nr:DUF2914 domain-containing protein [Gammaproteobacteria bacterium]
MMRLILFLSALLLSPPTLYAATSSPSASNSPDERAYVRRAFFTSGIENREPTGKSDFFYTTSNTVFFFTELRGMQGETVRYRWSYANKVVAEVEFSVTSHRWRSASSKDLLPEWIGEWNVELLNSQGEILVKKSFTYKEAP